jgi:Glu-tRNA(Gln) amidotransferase subunit E-like FAD-binding protein
MLIKGFGNLKTPIRPREHGDKFNSFFVYQFLLNSCSLLQTILTIEDIVAQVQNSYKSSKRNFESIRNECRQSLQQSIDKDSFKKMTEDVLKNHKQCAAEISATKKLGGEISEEISQGVAKLGECIVHSDGWSSWNWVGQILT